MEKGVRRRMSLQMLAISISFLMVIVVFPPSYFLGGNAVYAQTDPDLSGFTQEELKDFSDTVEEIDTLDTPDPLGLGTVDTGSGGSITQKSEADKYAILAAGAAATALVAAYTFTLPATTEFVDWKDPRGIENVPVRKNPYLCERPGNYTLGAKLDTTNAVSLESGKPLYTSGSRVTVFGEVEALSATCSGLELGCSEQRVQVCKVDRIFMGYKLEYQDCPSGFTQLHAEGERSERSVLGIVLLVVSLVAAVFSFGSAAGFLAGILGTGAKSAATIANIARIAGTTAGTGSTIVAQNVANSVDDEPCFNVCGKDYKSQDPSNPFCHKGGPVIGYKKVEYPCNQASCGPARSKKVSIDVKTAEGSRIQRADTSTDGVGSFSFTFNAPPQDGDFFVFVKVPK